MKKEMDFWDEIAGLGKLYLEKELVVGFEPVLFVCTDKEEKQKYLVMTYDSCNGIYVLIRIKNVELLSMLQNEITMEQTFRNGKSILKTYIDEDGIMRYGEFVSCEFDTNLLPKRGEYFELHSRGILDYIEKLKNERLSISKTYINPCDYEIDIQDTYYPYSLSKLPKTYSYLATCITQNEKNEALPNNDGYLVA